MNRFVLLTIFIASISILYAYDQEETFYLKNGQRVVGTIVEKNDSTGVYIVQTSYGNVTFNETDLQLPEVDLHLKTGEILKGELIEENDSGYKIRSSLGELTISRDNIDKMVFKNATSIDSDGNLSDGSGMRWYYGDERLIDIYFDPTGYLLDDNILYFSGLSWGYGLTDKIQITSKWSSYFWGDLNVRGKFQVFKTGNIKTEQVGALGLHLHTRGYPSKYEFKTSIEEWTDWDGTTRYDEYQNWEWVGNGEKPWFEFFGAMTQSNLKLSGQGRTNYTGGFSFTMLDGDFYNRFYGAVTSDVRKNLKLLFEVFYDPYSPSMMELMENKDDELDIGLDFGFIYAFNEKFRIGIHYQRPFLAFYYKL